MTPEQLRLWRQRFEALCERLIMELTADQLYHRHRWYSGRELELLYQWRQGLSQEPAGKTIQ